MNYQLLYQWEADIASRFPCLNTWQKANPALFSYGVIEAEACQQQRLAKVINAHEKQESGKKRFRRFLANEAFPGLSAGGSSRDDCQPKPWPCGRTATVSLGL